MSLLFPLGMAALGALVPLVALYLLKQKRIEAKVPAAFLWARAVDDLRASSLFQRLRATILLLLQAAAILLFALAAAGASLDLDLGETPRRVIALLDRSASMKTADEDGATRFDAAREILREQAAALHAADEMMIVAFDTHAEVAASFTGEKERLVSVIDALSPRDLPTRAGDALMLANSFAQTSPGFDVEVLFLSDGVVEEDLPAVPAAVRFVRMGKSGANQGITSLQVARTPGEPTHVFVRVENGDAQAAERMVTLRREGETVDARALTLPAGGAATAFFRVEDPEEPDAPPQVCTVTLEGQDVLAADDRATFVLRPTVPRTGLLVSDAPSLYLDPKKLEGLHPGLALVAVTPQEAAAALGAPDARIDLVVYDGVAPAAIPPVAGQIYVDALPPGAGLGRGAAQEFPIVIDWDRTHATTSRCQFDDLVVNESFAVVGAERSRVLIDSTGGPLALLTPVPGREVVVLAFSPGQSNFPLKLSWPLFLANTLDFLLARTERPGEEPVLATGDTLVIAPGIAARVTTPSGDAVDLEPDAAGRVAFTATHASGLYRVSQEGRPESVRACSLLDAREVRVAPREKLSLGSAAIEAAPRPAPRNVLLRDPLLLAALGVLLVEWTLWCSRR